MRMGSSYLKHRCILTLMGDDDNKYLNSFLVSRSETVGKFMKRQAVVMYSNWNIVTY